MFNSGYRGKREQDGRGAINPPAQYVQTIYPQPAITGWSISGSDDTSLDPAGGQTVLVNGSGFAVGVSATLGGSQIVSVTLVNPTQISFTAPANAGGSYTLIVYNSVGGAAILVPGLTYSSVPTWTTAAGSIGSFYETTAISSNVVATADSALTYSLSSGALPSGATLYANGVITGTAPVDSGSTTYTFNITATDAELQDTTRTFTMTINTDVVTWVSPANGTSYTTQANSAISNVSLSATDAAGYGIVYSANALPTGVSLSGNVIYGTPTTGGNTTTLLTATANTTSRTATNTIYWVVQLGDSYWNLTTLALNSLPVTTPFQSDASLNNASITVVGDAKAANYNPYQTGYYSNYFDGSGDSLTSPGSTAFTFGASDFTVEYWVYITAVAATYNQHVGAATTSAGFAFGTNASLKMYMTTSITGYTSTGTSFELNKWYHVAYCRSAGTVTFFMNGAVNYSTSASTTITETGFGIGNTPSGTAYPMTGYISNLRVTKGQALYATAFTPSTTPLTTTSQSATSSNVSLLTCQNNRFVDASAYNFALTKNGDTTAVPANPFATVYDYGTTYYSTYFDGSGDYLTVPSNAAFSLGTGDFTIECWVYYATKTNSGIFQIGATLFPGLNGIGLGLDPSLNWLFYYGNGSQTAPASTPTVGTWYHTAVVRSSSVTKVYIGGSSIVSVADSTNYTGTVLGIAGIYSTSYVMNGCISNFRITKGQALYTTTFTPSTTPLTTTSQGATAANVSILTCQDSTLIDNSLNAFAITSNGQAQPRPVSPFTTTNYTTASTTIPTLGSAYLDGSGDYLVVPYSPATNILSGDFTIECWIYPTSSGGLRAIAAQWNQTTGQGGWLLTMEAASGKIVFYFGPYNAGSQIYTGQSYTINSWQHIAVTRVGTYFYMYQNGTSLGASASTSATGSALSVNISFGNYYAAGGTIGATGATDYAGYISNFRIIKGTALYTANFYPGTTPLTAVSNTQLLTVQYNGGSNDSQFQDTSNYQNLVTRYGNATQGTFSPFSATGWSTYFNTSGLSTSTYNVIYTGSSANYDLSSSNSTVELWFFQTSYGNNSNPTANTTLFSIGTGGSYYYALKITSTGYFLLVKDGGSVVTSTSTTAVTNNVWHHLAWTHTSGGTNTFYLDGADITSTFSSSTNSGTFPTSYATPALYIGCTYYNFGSYTWLDSFNGYISNFRVVKGTIIYNSAFTPPTSPLVAVTNTLLLTCQSNRIIDNSTYRTALSTVSSPPVYSFSPFGPVTVTPYYSNYFDGSGDYLTLASNPAFSFGTGDFTVEAWVYLTSLATNKTILDARSIDSLSSYIFNVQSAGTLDFIYGASRLTSAATVSLNTWTHVAVSRSGSTIRLFINGTVDTNTATYASAINATAAPWIGGGRADSSGNPGYYVLGYISNLRMVKGLAVYTASFTPPTAPLTATQSSGTNISAITQASYSNYFDGTGDYLTVSSTAIAAFGFGTSNFTIEGWFYATADNSTDFMIDFRGGVATAPAIFLYTSNQLALYYNGSIVYQPSSLTFVINQWNHVALVRSSNVTKFYLNGTGAGTTYTDNNNYPSAACIIGSDIAAGGSSYWTGYISNIRITKGQALYTTNFTPSTTPLTTTSQGATAANVSLLTCQSSIFSDNSTNSPNAIKVSGDTAISGSNPFGGSTMLLTSQSSTFVDNSVNAFALTVNGNTIPSTTAPFAATTATGVSYTTAINGGSMYFDGTGDYLSIADSAALQFSTGNFTVECWVYEPTQTAYHNTVVGKWGSGFGTTGDWSLRTRFNNSNQYAVTLKYSGGWYDIQTSVSVSDNAWHHLAFVRDSTTSIKLYIDGVLKATQAISSSDIVGSSATMSIGGNSASATNEGASIGYISNVRIVNGTALYTAAFSPPTAPPTASAATTLLANGTKGSIIDYTGKNDMETVADARLAPQNPYGGSYYSNYFDGTGDGLITTTNSSTPVAGDFTWETWVYFNSLASSQALMAISLYASGSSTLWYYDTTNGIRYAAARSASDIISIQQGSTSGWSTGQWYHVALVRSGNTYTIYRNGTSVATGTSSSTPSTITQPITLGYRAYTGSELYLNGLLSNSRITNGQALYTSTFTPSTTPLTTTSQGATAANVSLLTCQSSTFKDNSTNAFTITRNGDTAVNSVNPFQNNGTYSMYFDGTGDGLVGSDSQGVNFGSGNFTIEFWAYFGSVASAQMVLSTSNSPSLQSWAIYTSATGTLAYYLSSNGSSWNLSDGNSIGTITTGQWYYVTLVRNGSTFTPYLNGVAGTTTTSASALYTNNLPLKVAYNAYGSTNYTTAYITDLRITKYARYTTAFTPPTTTFQTK